MRAPKVLAPPSANLTPGGMLHARCLTCGYLTAATPAARLTCCGARMKILEPGTHAQPSLSAPSVASPNGFDTPAHVVEESQWNAPPGSSFDWNASSLIMDATDMDLRARGDTQFAQGQLEQAMQCWTDAAQTCVRKRDPDMAMAHYKHALDRLLPTLCRTENLGGNVRFPTLFQDPFVEFMRSLLEFAKIFERHETLALALTVHGLRNPRAVPDIAGVIEGLGHHSVATRVYSLLITDLVPGNRRVEFDELMERMLGVVERARVDSTRTLEERVKELEAGQGKQETDKTEAEVMLSTLLLQQMGLDGESLRLNLSGRSLGSVGFKSLSASLPNLPSLLELHLAGNQAGWSGAEALSHGLSRLHRLEILDLSDNTIGDIGLDKLAPSLTCHSLHTLNLEYNDIGVQGVTSLAARLSSLPRLTDLNLGLNSFGPQGAFALSDGLRHLRTLRCLALHGNRIGPQGCIALCAAVPYFSESLDTLRISANTIGHDGTTCLAALLPTLSRLSTLDLGYNGVGPHGALQLSSSLGKVSCLVHLDLQSNMLGRDGVASVAIAIRRLPLLRTLILSHNGMLQDGATPLAQCLRFLPNLEHLEVQGNGLGDVGATTLATSLHHAAQLKVLDVSENDIQTAGMAALRQAVPQKLAAVSQPTPAQSATALDPNTSGFVFGPGPSNLQS